MNNYLCANHHHFRAPNAACPTPGCAAEVRPTAAHPFTGDTPSFAHLPKLAEEDRPKLAEEDRPVVKHTIKWWAVADGERIPRNSGMPASGWGWDATCACGWDSRTGGATMASVDRQVQDHKAGLQ